MSSIKEMALRNIGWNVFNGFSSQFIQFIVTLVIARLVTPEEFGLIAMLTIFISIGQVLIDGGLSTALIQKSDRTDVDKSTAYYFNLCVSILLYLVLFFFSPMIARFYSEPILIKLARVIGLNFIISALSLVQRTEFIINNDFKSITKCSFLAIVTSGPLGIIAAYYNLGVWALVIQAISFNLIQTILLNLLSKWKFTLCFSIESFKTLFPFASKLICSSILNVIYINSYTLVIGKFFTPSDVGYYTRSNMFAQFPSTYLTGFISKALFPIQCSIKDENKKLLLLIYKYISIVSLIVTPSMFLISVLAKPIICFFLTEKWIGASEFLMLLPFAYILIPIMSLNEILNVLGRSDLFLKSEFVKKILGVLCLIVSIPFGVRMMCFGLILYGILDSVVILFYLRKITIISINNTCKILFQPLISSLISSLFIYFITMLHLTYFVQLLVGVIAFVVIYLAILYILKNEILLSISNLIKDRGQ